MILLNKAKNLIISDPTSQLGLTGTASDTHWAAGYQSSYAAASYAAASSFAYGSGGASAGGPSAASADLAGQPSAIDSAASGSSQIPSGKPSKVFLDCIF